MIIFICHGVICESLNELKANTETKLYNQECEPPVFEKLCFDGNLRKAKQGQAFLAVRVRTLGRDELLSCSKRQPLLNQEQTFGNRGAVDCHVRKKNCKNYPDNLNVIF